MDVLALHGFTGHGEDFSKFSPFFAVSTRWHSPTLPGHGPSPAPDCTPEAMIDFVDRIRKSEDGERRSEDGSRKLEVRSQNAEDNVQKLPPSTIPHEAQLPSKQESSPPFFRRGGQLAGRGGSPANRSPSQTHSPQVSSLKYQASSLRSQASPLHPSPFKLQTSPSSLLLAYSMGARAALLHAFAHPDAWDTLVLISVSPGIEDATQRAARRASDEALAQRIERDGVPVFLEFWQNQPLIRSQQSIRPDWLAAMQNSREQHTAKGLATSLRQFGQGSCPNLWPKLYKITCPVLLITGEHDSKYCAIAERMQKILPNATHTIIKGAGHMPHLEAPEQTAAAIHRMRDISPFRLIHRDADRFGDLC